MQRAEVHANWTTLQQDEHGTWTQKVKTTNNKQTIEFLGAEGWSWSKTKWNEWMTNESGSSDGDVDKTKPATKKKMPHEKSQRSAPHITLLLPLFFSLYLPLCLPLSFSLSPPQCLKSKNVMQSVNLRKRKRQHAVEKWCEMWKREKIAIYIFAENSEVGTERRARKSDGRIGEVDS